MSWWTRWKGQVGQSWVRAVYRSAGVRRVFWGLAFGALLTAILASQVIPATVDVAVGEVSPVEIRAPRSVVNRVRTEQLRDEAAARVQPVLRVDPTVAEEAEEALRRLFADIRAVRSRYEEGAGGVAPTGSGMEATGLAAAASAAGESMPPGEEKQPPDPDARLEQMLRDLGSVLPQASQSQLRAIATADGETLRLLEEETVSHAVLLLGTAIRPEEVETVRTQVQNTWTPTGVESRELTFLAQNLVQAQIQANLVEDQAATQRARDQARRQVAAVVVKPDQRIVSEGEVVTREQYAMLEDLELVGPRAQTRRLVGVVGVALFSYLMVGLMVFYLWRYRPDVLERDARIVMIGVVAVTTVLVAVMVQGFSRYLMPWAVGTMLLSILIDTRVALVSSLIFGLITGLVTQGDYTVTAVATVSSFVGVYSVKRVEARADLIRAGLAIGFASVVTILALHLVAMGPLLDFDLWRRALLAIIASLLSAVLAAGSLPIMESLFGVLTPIKLLELANPNHPLLKRLMMEAPGTYHHTLMVANLSEAAAEAVGADAMLCRVGAYYHDIGKVKRPPFFTENQFGGQENPHDRLPPHVSALIIASHVKDGVEMAREHRLPEEIIDFIREHHGDMLISYFYHKATQNGTGERILEEDFRYEGPRPRRKETAICMLADGCEASVRAMRNRGAINREQIATQVDRIVEDRLHQGQLSGSDLTLRDLENIKRTFVRVLEGVHHGRIEYPKLADHKGGAEAAPGQSGEEPGEEPAATPDSGDGADAPAGGANHPAAGEPGKPSESDEQPPERPV